MPTTATASKTAAPTPRATLALANVQYEKKGSIAYAELQRKLIDSVHAEVGSRSIKELARERDELLIGLVELRNKRSETAASHKVAAE